VLTGKYLPGRAAPEGSRARDRNVGGDLNNRWMRDDVLARVQRLTPIAEELSLTMAQLAIAWVLQNDNIAAAIIGASRPEQVRQNAAASGVVIPEELMRRIDVALGDVVERDPRRTDGESPDAR
jgi:aryl-alcohol dehydrogenase-like predicted oxidoreductase